MLWLGVMSDSEAQGEITALLRAHHEGNDEAFDRLVPLVYDHLKVIARHRIAKGGAAELPGRTTLVHEAYLQLADETGVPWQNRAHFFAVCARVMRRIVVDHARRQGAAKRVGGRRDLTLEPERLGSRPPTDTILAALESAAELARDVFGPGSPEEREALRWLAQSQHYSGDLLGAERTLLQVLDEADAEPLQGRHPDLLDATLELADLQHSLGRLAAAEATLRRVLAVLERQGRVDETRARALRDLGNVLRDRGAWSDAETAYRQAVRILASLPGPVDQQTATVEIYLARLLTTTGRWDEAEALLERGSSTLRRVYGSEHPLTATAARNLAHLRIEQGRLDEAEEHLHRAREVLLEFLGPTHPMVARARVHEAELALRRGRYDEAVALAESSIALLRALGIGEHPSSLDACRTLAEALLHLGDPARAGRVLRPCARAGEVLFVEGDPRLRRDRELSARISAAGARPTPR